MADDAQVAVQVKQALALLYATGNKEADTWLQGFITQGYGRCLGPCALILDDAASQPHEALFAATATHQTLRKMQLREVATQRSHVVMSAEGAVALRRRLALRCSTAPPGPLQTRYALTLAAALLKSDQRDLVAIVAATLTGAPLAETLRALPEELEGLSMHPNLREQRRSELDAGAPVALDAILAQAQPCGAQRAFAAAAMYVRRLRRWRDVPSAVSLIASAREAMLRADGDVLESASSLLSAAIDVCEADPALADELLPLTTCLQGRRGDLCATAVAEAAEKTDVNGASRLAAALCAALHDTSSRDVAAAASLAAFRGGAADFVTFACRRASFQTARDPFEVNDDEAQAQDEDDVERDLLADGCKACAGAAPMEVLEACRAHVTAFPAGVLAVARSVLHAGGSSIGAPLAELGLRPVSAVVASSVNAQTGVCCGLFLQAVASSGLKPLATFAEVAARLASSHDATARRHGFVALLRILDADTNASSEACWRVCEAIVASDIDEPPLRPGREPVLALACRCLSRMAAGTDRLQPLLVSCVQRAESCSPEAPCKFAAAYLGLACVVSSARPLLLADVSAATRVSSVAGNGVLKCARAYPDEADEDIVEPARAADAACAVLAALVAPNWKDDAPKKRDAQCNSAAKGSIDEQVLNAAFQPALQSLQASCFRSISAPASLRILELVVCSCAHPSLASAVVGVLNEMCSRVRAPSLRCAVANAFKCCLRLPVSDSVDRCLFLLCQVQLTRGSDESEDDAAALKACARLFSTNLRRDGLALVLRAQRDGVLPSARVVDVARLVRTRYPPSELAADVRAALGLVVAEKGPDVAGDLAAAIRDEKKFKKLLKAMVGGKRKGSGS